MEGGINLLILLITGTFSLYKLTYRLTELIQVEQPQLLIRLFFSDSVPVDKVWRFKEFTIKPVPVSLDTGGQMRPGPLH